MGFSDRKRHRILIFVLEVCAFRQLAKEKAGTLTLSCLRQAGSDDRVELKAGTPYLSREYCQSIVWSRDKKNGMNEMENGMNEMSKNLNHILQKELMEDYHHSRDQNEESNVIIKQYQKFSTRRF